LDVGQGSVGYINAMWGLGAIAAAGGLAMLLDRGQLAAGLVIGSLAFGASFALPGAWPVVAAAYFGWLGLGFAYTLVEVAANTLLQRLADDEVLGRVRGTLESGRLVAMAVGSITVAALVELIGTRGALLAFAALMPLFALLRWRRLRAFEMGAPVEERHFALLRGSRIFDPLTVASQERLCHDLQLLQVPVGEEIVTQGQPGDLFYLIDSGQVEVIVDGAVRRHLGEGECFGEIALLRNVRRTATVRTTKDTRLLALDSDRFLSAVTGHRRSTQAAETIMDKWLAGPPRVPTPEEADAVPRPG
jgi:hypothetical protein